MRLSRFHRLVLFLPLVGCGANSDPDGPLVVATPWDRETRNAAAAARGVDPGTVRWVHCRWSDLGPFLDQRVPGVDLVLGVPSCSRSNLSNRIDDWVGVRMAPTPVASRTADPRHDGLQRARMLAMLSADGWRPGYARLVAEAGAESSHASPSSPASSPEILELGGVWSASQRAVRARAWLTRWRGEAPAPNPASASDDLKADLLGSVLIDAREDLVSATARVRAAGSGSPWAPRLLEPPPWPPASILRLSDAEGGADDISTLARALVPDDEARDWLLESWRRPRSDVDDALLDEIARVADGRLASEPRFRAWLRGEWSAWAGPWYRWVGRRAADGMSSDQAAADPTSRDLR